MLKKHANRHALMIMVKREAIRGKSNEPFRIMAHTNMKWGTSLKNIMQTIHFHKLIRKGEL